MNNNEVKASVMDIELILKIRRVIYLFIKRLFDFAISIIGIVLILPIAIIVKICYILTGDFHSIFYYQNRVGKNGKEFTFYKFRTMIPNADEELEKILSKNAKLRKEYEKNKKLKHDPRITKVGKILRRTSLDELPQMINIFNGTMSVIGNRPYLPREKDDMGVYFNKIVSTKPGLTGYWQVSGRSDTTFDRRLELEKYYSEHCGIIMDIGIFFKTFKVVIFGRGAK